MLCWESNRGKLHRRQHLNSYYLSSFVKLFNGIFSSLCNWEVMRSCIPQTWRLFTLQMSLSSGYYNHLTRCSLLSMLLQLFHHQMFHHHCWLQKLSWRLLNLSLSMNWKLARSWGKSVRNLELILSWVLTTFWGINLALSQANVTWYNLCILYTSSHSFPYQHWVSISDINAQPIEERH